MTTPGTKKSNPLMNVLHVFTAVAPTIGSVIASTNPLAGAVYSIATSLLSSHLKTDPTADAIASKLAAPTEADLQAVKAAESDFVEKMTGLQINLETLAVQDVQGARAYATATGNQLQRPMLWWLLGFTAVFSSAFVSFLIFFGGRVTSGILDALLPVGTLILNQSWSEVKDAFKFAFGGSQDKDSLAAAVSTAANATTNGNSQH